MEITLKGEPVQLSWVKIVALTAIFTSATLHIQTSGFENFHLLVPRCLKVFLVKERVCVEVFVTDFFSLEVCLCNKLDAYTGKS